MHFRTWFRIQIPQMTRSRTTSTRIPRSLWVKPLCGRASRMQQTTTSPSRLPSPTWPSTAVLSLSLTPTMAQRRTSLAEISLLRVCRLPTERVSPHSKMAAGTHVAARTFPRQQLPRLVVARQALPWASDVSSTVSLSPRQSR